MKLIAIIIVLLLSGCATQNTQRQDGKSLQLSEAKSNLASGYSHLTKKEIDKAMIDFDKVIKLCKEQYDSNKKRIYASRGTSEAFYYMLIAASEDIEAVAVGPTCAEALYLKGYTSLDLGLIKQAEHFINKALAMSPVNSKYLSELGHIYIVKRKWNNALNIFTKSVNAAESYSPPELKNSELTRAKRGVGYSLIELGRLDDAQKEFEECLKINKNDQKASNELKYIEKLKRKK